MRLVYYIVGCINFVAMLALVAAFAYGGLKYGLDRTTLKLTRFKLTFGRVLLRGVIAITILGVLVQDHVSILPRLIAALVIWLYVGAQEYNYNYLKDHK